MTQSTKLPQELTDHWVLGFMALPDEQLDQLSQTRHALAAGDTALMQTVDALKQAAEDALDLPLYSVVDDSIVPPSGDHHDYTSLGTYWWPNPDTADGLPYVRRDGQRNPETLKADFTAMSEMCMDCCVQILAWRLTDDLRFASKAIEQLRYFFLNPDTAMNPHLKYAQRIPGICDGRGIGLIDTHRMIPVVELLPLLHDCSLWTQADEQGMQQWFSQYLDWFENSDLGQTEHNEHNNHGTWHDAQVIAFALYTHQPQRARTVLEQVATKRIDKHLAPNGSQPHEEARTLSLTYSMFNLEGLFAMAIFGKRVGIDLWHHTGSNGQNLLKAIDYLSEFAGHIEDWPYPQIKPASPWKLAALLRIAQRYSNNLMYAKRLRSMGDLAPMERLFSLIYPTL
jgi:hypothetical protein